MTKFRTVYDHAKPVSPSGTVSLTDQQYLKDCDINVLLKRYSATGQLPASYKPLRSGDFSAVGDFADCLERVRHARESFESLPSELRARFGNDPTAYVDFVLSPDNVDECIRLGLRVKPDEPVDTPVDILQRIEKAMSPVTSKEEISA